MKNKSDKLQFYFLLVFKLYHLIPPNQIIRNYQLEFQDPFFKKLNTESFRIINFKDKFRKMWIGWASNVEKIITYFNSVNKYYFL